MSIIDFVQNVTWYNEKDSLSINFFQDYAEITVNGIKKKFVYLDYDNDSITFIDYNVNNNFIKIFKKNYLSIEVVESYNGLISKCLFR